MLTTNLLVINLVKKYRKEIISEPETKKLFKIFKDRESSILKFTKKANGLYEINDLLSAYYEGIIRAMIGKDKEGKYITDLNKTETVISKIWSHGVGYARSFIHKNSKKKLLIKCDNCGKLNEYYCIECAYCHKIINRMTKITFEKETNINKLINDPNIEESKKFDIVNFDEISSTELIEEKLDFGLFINKLKYELDKRNLKQYFSIVNLLMKKEIIESGNYLKAIGDKFNISPQSINTKIKKIKKIAKKYSFTI